MDQQNPSVKRQMPSAQVERRNPNKLVRVAFDPDVDAQKAPSDQSPPPPSGRNHHHRSFTAIDQKLQPLPKSTTTTTNTTSSGRPTSSSAGDGTGAVVAEERPRLTSDRASDSGRPTAALKRAKSDYGPRMELDKSVFGDDEEDIAMRHGWQEEYTSSEYLKVLHSVSDPADAYFQCDPVADHYLELLYVFHRKASRHGRCPERSGW